MAFLGFRNSLYLYFHSHAHFIVVGPHIILYCNILSQYLILDIPLLVGCYSLRVLLILLFFIRPFFSR